MSVDLVALDGGIISVTMNWPEKRNALGPNETREVGDALVEACRRSTLGVILTGNGAFCAGGDLEQFARVSATSTIAEIRSTIYENVHSVIRAIRQSPIPIVAAVDGAAIGLGLDYALACDMCFVGPGGWFRQGWAAAGLIHGAGGSVFIQRAAGQQIWRLLSEQERFDGAAAAVLGLAETSETRAGEAAEKRLRSLAHLPRSVLHAYTSLLRQERWPRPEFFERCADLQAQFIGSHEFRNRVDEMLAG